MMSFEEELRELGRAFIFGPLLVGGVFLLISAFAAGCMLLRAFAQWMVGI